MPRNTAADEPARKKPQSRRWAVIVGLVIWRLGTDGLAPWGGGRSVLDGTNADNSARSGLVVYEAGGGGYCMNGALSSSCLYLYRHELGHTLGIYTNTDAGLMGSATNLSDREKRMLAALYSLPHGAAVEADGSWRVVGQ